MEFVQEIATKEEEKTLNIDSLELLIGNNVNNYAKILYPLDEVGKRIW